MDEAIAEFREAVAQNPKCEEEPSPAIRTRWPASCGSLGRSAAAVRALDEANMPEPTR